MGFDLTTVGDGEVTFTGMPEESVYNPIGVVSRGLRVHAARLRTGLRRAVHPAGRRRLHLDRDQGEDLAAVRADIGQLTVYGRVTKPGRRVAFADGDVRDAAGNVLATSQSSFLVINPTG
jgi:hypothetical protein